MSEATRPLQKIDAQGQTLSMESGYLTLRADYTDGNLIYLGHARPGTAEGASAWRIQKFTYSGTAVTKSEFPNGVATFTNSWTGRTGLSYS
ncbi:MAG: hypothetical protein ACFFG0_19195 [Candidatus Thorarchaeota archaeon]